MPELFVPLVMMAIVGTFAFNFQTVMPLLIKRTHRPAVPRGEPASEELAAAAG